MPTPRLAAALFLLSMLVDSPALHAESACSAITAPGAMATTMRVCLRADSLGHYACLVTEGSDLLTETCEFIPNAMTAASQIWTCASSSHGVSCTPRIPARLRRVNRFYVEF